MVILEIMLITFLQITSESIDSLGNIIIPGSSVTSLWWWISILGLFLLGILKFLVNHKVKTVVLDEHPRPSLFIEVNGKLMDTITFHRVEMPEMDDYLNQQLSVQMQELMQKYNIINLDLYHNPMLMIQSNFNEVSSYDADVQEYIEDMKLYYQRTILDKYYSQYLKPVQLVLYGKGSKSCTNVILDLSFIGDMDNLFDAKSFELKQDVHVKDPNLSIVDRSSEFYGFFPADKEAYSYQEWKLKPLSSKDLILINVVVPGVLDKKSIPLFWVDTRWISHYKVSYKINGTDIPEGGVKGEITINVTE